jgi:hypothetical protein
VNIALINSISFYIGIKRKKNEFFTISLYEINYIINKKQRSIKVINKLKVNILKRTVPLKYYNLINVFSKKESNKLPLYYLYNYKIKLIGNILLRYYLLYY